MGTLVDGTHFAGHAIHDWGKKGENPRLDDQPLADIAQPVRWLRDNTLPVPVTPPAFVEMAGGDRLPGNVVEYVPPTDGTTLANQEPAPDEARSGPRALPAHLIVEPESGAILRFARQRPEIRVRTAWLRRIVWQRSGLDRYEPNTLRLRSGGTSTFRSLQFTATGVKLLKGEGVEQFPFAEIAEIHLPEIDPWIAHYQQLVVLTPEGNARLVRWETSDGLRATGSLERFQAFDGPGDRPDGWVHLLQPAWSLSPLYVWHPSIRLRTWFEPSELPLSALEPAATRRQPIFSGAWDWRTDKNCRGGALRCGARSLPGAWASMRRVSWISICRPSPPACEPASGSTAWPAAAGAPGAGLCVDRATVASRPPQADRAQRPATVSQQAAVGLASGPGCRLVGVR